MLICREKEEIHLKELRFFGRSINNNINVEINNNKNNIEENNNDFIVNRKSKEKELNNSINNLYNIKKSIKNFDLGSQYLSDNSEVINNNNNL